MPPEEETASQLSEKSGKLSVQEQLALVVTEIFPSATQSQAVEIVQQFLSYLVQRNPHLEKVVADAVVIEGFKTRLWQMVISRRQTVSETDDIRYCLNCPAYLCCKPSVIYSDENYIAINKPWDYRLDRKVSETPQFIDEPTLSEYVCRLTSDNGSQFVQRFCNQLDYATSGIVLFAKSSKACGHVGRQFSQRRVSKTYLAIVLGHLDIRSIGKELTTTTTNIAPGVTVIRHADRLEVQLRLKEPDDDDDNNNKSFGMEIDCYEGKSCSTIIIPRSFGQTPLMKNGQLLLSAVPSTLLSLHPETGRRHQLRVSLASLGYPIIGDVFYGQRYAHLVKPDLAERVDHSQIYRMALHASEMRLNLSNQEITIIAPDEFSNGNEWLFIPTETESVSIPRQHHSC